MKSAEWRTDPALSRNLKPPAFSRWRIHAEAGVWERVFEHLIEDPDNSRVSLDSSLVRAHQQAATGKGSKGGIRRWGVPEVV